MPNIAVTQKDSLIDQLERVRHRLEQRAYDLFRRRDGAPGDALADWLTAEHEMLTKPTVELREEKGVFTVIAPADGFDPKDMSVDLTSEDMVIKGETTHTQSKTKGQVQQSEFTSRELFQSVHFPKPVDPTKAKAEYRNGVLTVTVPAASEAPTKAVTIEAA
jgi:HSP20 family protein